MLSPGTDVVSQCFLARPLERRMLVEDPFHRTRKSLSLTPVVKKGEKHRFVALETYASLFKRDPETARPVCRVLPALGCGPSRVECTFGLLWKLVSHSLFVGRDKRPLTTVWLFPPRILYVTPNDGS